MDSYKICNYGCSKTCSCSGKASGESTKTTVRNDIKNSIIVLSGKGGVGKSTIAVNLAMALTLAGKKVGLLDIDMHGPSIPTMLNLTSVAVKAEENCIVPVDFEGLKVMSIGFLLKHKDDPVIYRGPVKDVIIQEFLADVAWGELDYLVVDSPPGTGDEPISSFQLLKNLKGAVIVTTPQEMSAADVRKSVNFCRKTGTPILGIIENMSGFTCPVCSHHVEIFGSGGGKVIADKFNIPFLGSLPIEKTILEAGDNGKPFIKDFPNNKVSTLFLTIIKPLLNIV